MNENQAIQSEGVQVIESHPIPEGLLLQSHCGQKAVTVEFSWFVMAMLAAMTVSWLVLTFACVYDWWDSK